jgi:hypothetical protein
VVFEGGRIGRSGAVCLKDGEAAGGVGETLPKRFVGLARKLHAGDPESGCNRRGEQHTEAGEQLPDEPRAGHGHVVAGNG